MATVVNWSRSDKQRISINYIFYPGKQNERLGLWRNKKQLKIKDTVYETFPPVDFNSGEHCCCENVKWNWNLAIWGKMMDYEFIAGYFLL